MLPVLHHIAPSKLSTENTCLGETTSKLAGKRNGTAQIATEVPICTELSSWQIAALQLLQLFKAELSYLFELFFCTTVLLFSANYDWVVKCTNLVHVICEHLSEVVCCQKKVTFLTRIMVLICCYNKPILIFLEQFLLLISDDADSKHSFRKELKHESPSDGASPIDGGSGAQQPQVGLVSALTDTHCFIIPIPEFFFFVLRICSLA